MRRSVVLLSTLLLFFSIALVSPLCAAESLSVVSVAPKQVQLTATMGIEQVRYFTLDSPKRLVVDLYGVLPGSHEGEFTLSDGFKLLRVGPLDNKSRFVFDVSGAIFPTFKVDIESDKVVISWEHPQNTTAAALSEPTTIGSAKITAIDFTAEVGQSKVFISLNGNADVSALVRDGNKIQFALKNTTLPQSLRRVFDTLAFPSAIYSVTPYLVNASGQSEVRFTVLLKGDVPYGIQKSSSGYVFVVNDGAYGQSSAVTTGTLPVSAQGQTVDTSSTVAAAPLVPASGSGTKYSGSSSVPVIKQIGAQETNYAGEKTSLVFDNAEVRDILRLIAEISELNIIVSDEVKGNVTLRLIDVPWDQALDLVLDVTALGMVQQGNVVRVLPIDKIRSMKEAELTADRSQEKLESLATEVITVSYADLASVSAPAINLLSDRGNITPDDRNKFLIVTDVPQRIEEIKELIAILDTPERQVMIEARIIEVSSEYTRALGIDWGITHNLSEDVTIGTNVGGSGFLLAGNAALNGTSPLGYIEDLTTLDLKISAFESANNLKVISTPRVTTLNGEEATITQGIQEPTYVRDGDGNTTTEWKDVTLELKVKPVINPDGSIILEIDAKNDSKKTGSDAINKKSAKTKVLVQDGETTVLGGVFVEKQGYTDGGVPYLKNIPGFGHLFKHDVKDTSKNELLIFVTPRIIRR